MVMVSNGLRSNSPAGLQLATESANLGDAPGTCHPLDDEWYIYEATNGMRFNLPKRYKVKEELGTGSYAAVLSADDLVSGETIAIKR